MPKLAMLHWHVTVTLCCWQGAARSKRWQGESQAAAASRRAVKRWRKGFWLNVAAVATSASAEWACKTFKHMHVHGPERAQEEAEP